MSSTPSACSTNTLQRLSSAALTSKEGYVEDSAADVDMNVIMTESGKFVEIQGTAEEEPFSRDELNTLLDLAKKGTDAIFAAQREAVQDGDFQQS